VVQNLRLSLIVEPGPSPNFIAVARRGVPDNLLFGAQPRPFAALFFLGETRLHWRLGLMCVQNPKMKNNTIGWNESK
jgi:hypothetical protein